MASSVKDGNEVTLMIKWGGKEYKVTVGGEDSVKDVKRRIYEQTNVLPKRQKLLNLKVKGKLADDDALVGELALKPGLKIMMMGTAEEELLVEPEEAPEILDDFDVGEEETVHIKDREENLLKVQKRIEQYKISVLNPPRAGKRLLVLDVDYTIFDHRSTAETPAELQRPYLHEFLTACYAEFDLMIWSATSMKWVEVKMRELGVLSNPDYKITALLDHGAMITVTSNSRVFDCKPLAVIWAKFPEYYHEGNTVMFDDLRRNFVMNPKNGLVIRPFRKAHLNRDNDRELVALTRYLLAISELEDFSTLDHGRWEEFSSRRHPN